MGRREGQGNSVLHSKRTRYRDSCTNVHIVGRNVLGPTLMRGGRGRGRRIMRRIRRKGEVEEEMKKEEEGGRRGRGQ